MIDAPTVTDDIYIYMIVAFISLLVISSKCMAVSFLAQVIKKNSVASKDSRSL